MRADLDVALSKPHQTRTCFCEILTEDSGAHVAHLTSEIVHLFKRPCHHPDNSEPRAVSGGSHTCTTIPRLSNHTHTTRSFPLPAGRVARATVTAPCKQRPCRDRCADPSSLPPDQAPGSGKVTLMQMRSHQPRLNHFLLFPLALGSAWVCPPGPATAG